MTFSVYYFNIKSWDKLKNHCLNLCKGFPDAGCCLSYNACFDLFRRFQYNIVFR